jgi:transposase-like protein
VPKVPAEKIELLALAVASGLTVRAWAETNGVVPRTAYRWSGRPDFKARVIELRREIIRAVIGELTEASREAVAKFRKLLKDAKSESVQLAAGRAIMEQLVAMESHAELATRLDELEAQIEKLSPTAYPRGT